jgi:adenylylsulfate kinase-like enzyme
MVIVISGPIASGKSSVARGVARSLRGRGIATAIVDLDELYAKEAQTMGEPRSTAARWRAARRAAAALANSHTAEGLAAVIVEGSFQTQRDRLVLTESLGSRANLLHVSLRVSYEEALRRAQLDPTRGRSRDPSFLRRYYARQAATETPDTGLVIETESNSEEGVVAAVVEAVLARLP